MKTRRPRLRAQNLSRLLSIATLVGVAVVQSIASAKAMDSRYELKATTFASLPGFADERHDEALRAFVSSCAARSHSASSSALPRPGALKKVCALASLPDARNHPRLFFEHHFQPYQITEKGAPDAFFTGYYQPEISGSLVQSAAFPTPVYALPRDLVVLPKRDRVGVLAELTAARRASNGALAPYPDRAAIEDGALETRPGFRKLVFLRDKVDLFLAQVQGSARVRLEDGRVFHLAFAGRNGQPYTALARILVQRDVAPASEMTMRRLTAWLRQNGLERGEAGDELLRLNRSYVFFDGSLDKKSNDQPLGGSGAHLSPLRSIAVDAHIWPYGLPFFINAAIPWRSQEVEAFQRLMIAQDTGSAIVGAARADIYFGLGDAAGARAGELRHHGQFFVLLPKE